jgi:hypothetical protein
MNKRYTAVIEIYALAATYPPEGAALRDATQFTALGFLQRTATKQELLTLVTLGHDLAYMSDESFRVLAQLLRDL